MMSSLLIFIGVQLYDETIAIVFFSSGCGCGCEGGSFVVPFRVWFDWVGELASWRVGVGLVEFGLVFYLCMVPILWYK